jgi:general stress protein 26
MRNQQMTEAGNPNTIWTTISKLHVCMLTTEDEGQLVSRPMASLARPDDGKIYFITHLATGKVGDIGGSAPVNLAYADPHANTYVSISGTARTSQDRTKLRELWGFYAEAWLPQGPDDADTALIEVDPHEATLWDGTRSSLIQTVKMALAVTAQRPPSGGRVEQVQM